jgi:hypothetical protein
MSGSAQLANVVFPLVAGGFLPGGVATGTRAQNVQGCSAVNSGTTYWQIILNRPIAALKCVVILSAEGGVGQPFTPQKIFVSETSIQIYHVNAAGAQGTGQGISFMIFEVPSIV